MFWEKLEGPIVGLCLNNGNQKGGKGDSSQVQTSKVMDRTMRENCLLHTGQTECIHLAHILRRQVNTDLLPVLLTDTLGPRLPHSNNASRQGSSPNLCSCFNFSSSTSLQRISSRLQHHGQRRNEGDQPLFLLRLGKRLLYRLESLIHFVRHCQRKQMSTSESAHEGVATLRYHPLLTPLPRLTP